jgi:predicted SAM-dependent methyltransferase
MTQLTTPPPATLGPTKPLAADDQRIYTVPPISLPAPAQTALIERTLRDAAERGLRRIAVFPAGRHSARLTPDLFARCGVELAAFIDESRTGTLHAVEIIPPHRVHAPNTQPIDAVLISSDSAERNLAARALAWADATPILRPYQILERPGYDDTDARRARFLHMLRHECTGRVNLGCGSNPLPGWTNIDGGDGLWYDAPQHPDVIPLEVFDALQAIHDQSCDFVYSEHFYEHFTLADGFRLASEWARILKPGGVARVVTPDLTREVRMYLGEQIPTDPKTYLAHKRRWLGTRHVPEVQRFLTPAMLLNFGMRLDGHQFVYDFESLRAQLESAGFESVTRERFGNSTRPELRGIDRHNGGDTGGAWMEEIALVVEAVRKR